MSTVTVACKLPMGIHLDIHGVGRVTLKGTSVPFGAPPAIVQGGYALTTDVNEDFFNRWLEESKETELVKKNIIFAMPKSQDARAKAKELADVRTGLEPTDPEKPGQGVETLRPGN